MSNVKEFKCYSRAIAYQLRLKGFKIIRVEPNYLHPQYDVYVFAHTPEIEIAFDRILKDRGERNGRLS